MRRPAISATTNRRPSYSTLSPTLGCAPAAPAETRPASLPRPRAERSSAAASPGRAASCCRPATVTPDELKVEVRAARSNSSSSSPDNLLEHIFRRHHPHRRAELVHHDRDLPPPLLELLQQLNRQLRLRNNKHVAHHLPQRQPRVHRGARAQAPPRESASAARHPSNTPPR